MILLLHQLYKVCTLEDQNARQLDVVDFITGVQTTTKKHLPTSNIINVYV